jgi:hypothetical protein
MTTITVTPTRIRGMKSIIRNYFLNGCHTKEQVGAVLVDCKILNIAD